MKDPYIQSNGTLKNKLGIKEYPEPEHLERLIKQSIQVGIEREKEKHNMLLGRQKYDELTL